MDDLSKYKDKYSRTKKIKGTNYTIQMLQALPALKVGRAIASVVTPSLGAAFDGIRDASGLQIKNTFTDIGTVLIEHLDRLDLDFIIPQLLDGLEAEGKDIDFNEHFRGDFAALIELIAFAAQENFESFFTGNPMIARLKETLAQLAEPMNVESSAPSSDSE